MSAIDLEHRADNPPELLGMPGEISITGVPGIIQPEEIQDITDRVLEDRPHITNAIIRYGKDAVAMATSRGVMLYVGIGVATLATIAGGVLIWRHLHKKDSPEVFARKINFPH